MDGLAGLYCALKGHDPGPEERDDLLTELAERLVLITRCRRCGASWYHYPGVAS